MKRRLLLLLRGVVILIAISALFLMIKFPQTEGRAANLDLISIYSDPFIIYMYLASIPFFIALHQAFKLLIYFDKYKTSSKAVSAFRKIKNCAISIIVFIIGAEAYLFIVERGKSDDIAGGVAMGIFITIISIIVAIVASIFEKQLQNTKHKILR